MTTLKPRPISTEKNEVTLMKLDHPKDVPLSVTWKVGDKLFQRLGKVELCSSVHIFGRRLVVEEITALYDT